MSLTSINRKVVSKLILVVFVVCYFTAPAFAVVSNPTMTMTQDTNGDGIAGIGDTITFSCRSSAVTAGDTPYVDLSVLGNAHQYLPQIVGNYYSCVIQIVSGSYDNAAFRPNFIDDNSIVNAGNQLSIDAQPPRSTLGVTLDVSQAHGTGGIYKLGDRLVFTITMNDADGQNGPPRMNVYADLTNLGLGTNVLLSYSGLGVFSYNEALIAGRERIGDTFSLRTIDDAGNETTFAKGLSYDTKVPVIQSVTATCVDGHTIVKPGDTIKITAIVTSYDNETLTASHSTLIPGSPVAMDKASVSADGLTATFEYQFQVASGTQVDSTYVRFYVEATDDAGNTTNRWSNALAFDTIPPGFSDANVSIIERSGVANDNIAIIGDTLHFWGHLSQVFDDVQVTIDLSAIGGVSNQILTIQPASTTFELYYDVHQYTSEDTIPRSFNVKALDKANNVIYTITLPVIYVDNTPPTITSGQLSKVTTGGGTAKLGDTIGIQANITNLDAGSIWTDLGCVGGIASSTLTLSGGSTYRIEHVIAAAQIGYTAIDTTKKFLITVADNAGNCATIDTNTYPIDNEPPLIINATYTMTPLLSPTHPWVKIGDTVKFMVSLATPSTAVHDGETVTMNLSAMGGNTSQALTYDGVATYSFQMVVPSGSLNTDTGFSVIAKDNADNTVYGNVTVHIDNTPPTAGTMTVNYLTDLAKVGAVNLGDRMEIIIPVADPDFGTCTLDLSLLGTSSAVIMSYDSVLARYYYVWDTATATIENSTYVFKAVVYDKAGNSMNSLSSSFEVDCVPPVIYYASATFVNYIGSTTVVNVGDKVTITCSTEKTRLDGGTPVVNLKTLGGPTSQILYDDGAHDDGGAGDGLYGFTYTAISGTTDGNRTAFIVELTDNAGNRVAATTEALFVDNQPLVFTSATASQSFDNNNNGIIDLDGYYTTYPIVATDTVRISVAISGNSTDFSALTVNLTPLGINNTVYPLAVTAAPTGWTSVTDFQPLKGTTNLLHTTGELPNATFTLTLTDVNGNTTIVNTPAVFVDNMPPTIQVYPITFVTDNGRLNEANENDVIRIKVRLNNHDAVLAQIDWENLFSSNGLVPPSPTLIQTGGPNEYSYDWTVPQGLGTLASLPIIAYDLSGNMVLGYTNAVRFLSKTPTIRGYPTSRCQLSSDSYPLGWENHIANPGDLITLTCVLSSVYNASNTPPAVVLADVRALVADGADDYLSQYYDGDYTTYWYPLTYQAPPISGAGNYVYTSTFTVEQSRKDISLASFPVKVLHPDVTSIAMATSTLQCDPNNPFGIDTLLPNIISHGIAITNNNGDNLRQDTANIGDLLTVFAHIRDFDDPGSASVRLMSSSSIYIGDQTLTRSGTTDLFETTFTVATSTVIPWNLALQGRNPHDKLRYDLRVSDDADNMVVKNDSSTVSTFTVDNTPTALLAYQTILNPNNPFNWVANVGSGTASDSITASMAVDIRPSFACIDLSSIGGSSSWPINFPAGNTIGYSPQFVLATPGIDLATYGFPLAIIDTAGNYTASTAYIAIDTTRPRLISSQYDGERLFLTFSEPLYLSYPIANYFDQTKIRMGCRSDLTGYPVPDASFAVQLTPLDVVEEIGGNSDRVSILTCMETRSYIAEWGSVTLYLSMGTSSYNGEGASVSRDLSGNWVVPILQNPATSAVTVTVPYAVRPNLVRGHYDAVNAPTELHLEFDKDMASSTFTTDKFSSLSVVRYQSYDTLPADYTKRYTGRPFIDLVKLPNPSTREMVVNLSEQAQDWIAVKFQRTAANISLAVATIPVLIRDLKGNRVNTIPFTKSIAASLTPIMDNFNINAIDPSLGYGLDINTNILTISVARKARLFGDEYQVSAPVTTGYSTTYVTTSKIFLFKNANRSGSYIPLTRASVPRSVTTGPLTGVIINDYASTTIRIQLSADDIKDILAWNTSAIYIACEEGSFKDMWGNSSNKYPLSGTDAVPLPIIFPGGYPGPKVVAVAVSDPPPTKGWPTSSLYYEVDFETAVLPSNITVPVNRDQLPSLKVNLQDTGEEIDVGSFVAWLDYDVSGIKRTVARFVNSREYRTGIQFRAGQVTIDNCWDVFGTPISPSPTVASLVYDTADRITSGSGFNNASSTFIIDTQQPSVVSVIPTGTIGITPLNSNIFVVTFNEDMDQTNTSRRPSLRLGDSSTTVVSFNFDSWLNARQARYNNAIAFNDTTPQGSYTYYVSGGYDLAGNKGNDNVEVTSGKLEIRSRGPIINNISVTTYQFTTSKLDTPSGNVTGKPFSPYVIPSGIATITINYSSAPNGPNWLHIYQGNSSLASFPILISAITGTVDWNGTLKGVPIGVSGPTTYELRIYDSFANEGSARGSIVYDGVAPTVLNWNLTNAPTVNGKTYFSPKIHSFVKVDVTGAAGGESLYMRVINPGISTDVYPLAPLAGGGYTISFDGKATDQGTPILRDAEYYLQLVDAAGNLGVPLAAGAKAAATLVIDNTDPQVAAIQTFRTDNGSATTRFNPRVTTLSIQVGTGDLGISSGTALVRIRAGTKVIRDVPLTGAASPFTAIWDGRDSNGQMSSDGTYRISVIDLAENESTLWVDVDLISSVFKVTAASQVDRLTVRLTFSVDVNTSDSGNPNNYTLSPNTPSGIGAVTPISVKGKVVEFPLNQVMGHGVIYTVTVAPGLRSIDDDPITVGNNSAQFTADTQGPLISNVTFDGISTQKEFNVVFDEQVTATSATRVGNYSLVSGTGTVALSSVTMRADNKSVKITAFQNILESVNYTIIASGVEDLYKNPSSGSLARGTFQGKDVTPPTLTVTVFSNPANEFDISVAALVNEDITGAPSATITQSGGTAVSLALNTGPSTRLFIGGAHLDKSYPGVATIQVTAKDLAGNVGTYNTSFSTAYINSSVRAEVVSSDNRFSAVFQAGALNQSSMISLFPVALNKISLSSSIKPMIRPSVFAAIDSGKINSLKLGIGEGIACDELVPIDQGYYIGIPSGRLAGSYEASFKAPEGGFPKGTCLYFLSSDGQWSLVGDSPENGILKAVSSTAGTFALLRDILAPRVSLLTKIEDEKPFQTDKPVFEWSVMEEGSGIENGSIKFSIDGSEVDGILEQSSGKISFKPMQSLLGGLHSIAMVIRDNAGNQNTIPAIMFSVMPPLTIHEIIQFPNPARSRVSLRISTNRPDISSERVEINIYDVSGKKVKSGNDLSVVDKIIGARKIQDFVWDLTNDNGKAVANGVYIARITVHDPDDWDKKTKVHHKIAVLK